MSKPGGGKKFAPKIPASRRKDRVSAAGSADAPPESQVPLEIAVKQEDEEVFKRLQEASAADVGWDRGMGRGRGRGRGRFGSAGLSGPMWGPKSPAGGPAGQGGPSRPSAAPGATAASGAGAKGGHAGPSGGPSGKAGAAHPARAAAGAGLADGSFVDTGWEDEPPMEDLDSDVEEDMKSLFIEDLFGKEDHHPDLLPHPWPGQPLPDPLDKTRRKLPNLLERPDRSYNAAQELALLDNDGLGESLMLFQMPALLPCKNAKKAAAAANAPAGSNAARLAQVTKTDELPAGKIGKLIVFRSGQVKMQLGDVLMDVRPCIPTEFRQDVVAIRERQGTATWLGEVTHRAAVTPDVQQLLMDQPVPRWEHGPMLVNKQDEPKAEPMSPDAHPTPRSPPYSPTRKRAPKGEPCLGSPPHSGALSPTSPPTSPRANGLKAAADRLQQYVTATVKGSSAKPLQGSTVQQQNGTSRDVKLPRKGARMGAAREAPEVAPEEDVLLGDEESTGDPMDVDEEDFVGEGKWGTADDDLADKEEEDD